MAKSSKRQQIQNRQQKQKMRNNLIWVGLGLIAVAVIAAILWQGAQPTPGEAVEIMAETGHIPTGSELPVYNSNPPTSGQHYPDTASVGFYDEDTYPNAAGFLVHNLEHGYVIFWYNCDLLDEAGCTTLKEQIKTTMNELGGVKMIAYPWKSIDVPLVLTSWGRIQRFETFDADLIKSYYKANLNKSPEPNAP